MRDVFDMLSGGGIVMIPLLLTSVIGLAVVIERALFLRRRRILRPELVKTIETLHEPEEVERAWKAARSAIAPRMATPDCTSGLARCP